nr:tetratricopeptide repeat protein 25-like [Nomia melanderi]
MAVLASGGPKDELRGLNELDEKHQILANCSGDYESALVLYHRAANLFPRDSSHKVAVMRATSTISSCNDPPRAPRRTSTSNESEENLVASLCPETAAILANEKLKKTPNPASVTEVLSYFDNHKRFWKTLPSPRPTNTRLARSKLMLRQLSNAADRYLADLESAFNAGKMAASAKVAQELLTVSEALEDPSRYQIASYHYLSLIHVALKRHDLAVCSASRLIRLSKSTGDLVQFCRALVTLGKVHLSFGHLNAAAKAWEHLAVHLEEPIPAAWIRHEIGRCYLETGKYPQAMDMAAGCVQAAEEANCGKWLLHGKLLLGQSLAKLGRFAEASRELRIAARITEEEGDTPMQSYIRDLIARVTSALNRAEESKIRSSRSDEVTDQRLGRCSRLVDRTETVITYSQKRIITEYKGDGSSSEASVDGETTARLEHSTRSDLDEENSASRGDGTFRVEEPTKTSKDEEDVSSVCSEQSSSAASSASYELEETGNLGEDSDEVSEVRAAETDAAKGVPKRQTSGTSMKTVNTDATYVIEDRDDDGVSGRMGTDDVCGRTAARKEDDATVSSVRMIEQLAMEDPELLKMARNLLMMSGTGDRSRDSGDAERFGIFWAGAGRD